MKVDAYWKNALSVHEISRGPSSITDFARQTSNKVLHGSREEELADYCLTGLSSLGPLYAIASFHYRLLLAKNRLQWETGVPKPVKYMGTGQIVT